MGVRPAAFDDTSRSEPGTIDFVFDDGCFLVSCLDGRLLVKDYSVDNRWAPLLLTKLESIPADAIIKSVLARHREKYPSFPIANRITNHLRKH